MPQPRKDVPPRLVAGLRAAAEVARVAIPQRDLLIGQALKAGASARAVAEVVGLAEPTVWRIGQLQGWPTPKQRAEWDAVHERVAEWKARLGEWELLSPAEQLDRLATARNAVADYILRPED